MTVETVVTEQPWVDVDGRLRLERRQTDTFDDGSFTVTVSNEMPVGATVISRNQYDAQIAATMADMANVAEPAPEPVQDPVLTHSQTVGMVQQRNSIQAKLIGLGFTADEAIAMFP